MNRPGTKDRDQHRQRGATATELAVIMPVLILVVMIPIQVGLWWHAKQAAETAAEEALDAAQVTGATATDGHHGAHAILDRAGNLRNVTITVDRGPATVTVEVRGALGFSILPGAWSVTARAAGPVERFVPETDR